MKIDDAFGVFDTEDDSRELMESGKSGFDKSVTQIAALTCAGDFYHNRGNVDDFLDWLRASAAQGCSTWFAHNLQYDLGNLFRNRLDTLKKKMVGGRLIRVTWEKITFLDSFNLFPTSVKKLGKEFNLKKLEFDAHGKEYVRRDVEIPMLAINALRETCKEFELRSIPATLGGLCVSIWKAMGGQNVTDVSAFSKSAVFGGRTELFASRFDCPIAYTDINSLYPWAMTRPFPGRMRRTSSLLRYGITSATVRVPEQFFAPLPLRVSGEIEIPGVYENSIIFPVGRFRGTWTNAELFNAVEHHGVVIERIHQSFGTDSAFPFYADFVTEFYRRRLEAGSDAYRLIYKLLMNNLYGQLAMGGVITTSCALSDGLRKKMTEGKLDGTIYGDSVMYDIAVPLPDHVNYAHGAYVTAYGRIRLSEFMRQIGSERMGYCDTDSCVFTDPGNIPFAIGKELGEMKLEGVYSGCRFYAPKTYRIFPPEGDLARTAPQKDLNETIVKAKGVKHDFADTFIDTGEAEYAIPFRVREAVMFYDRIVASTRSIKGRDVPVYAEKKAGNAKPLSVWRKIKKQFRSSYQKKILSGNSYHPIYLNMK